MPGPDEYGVEWDTAPNHHHAEERMEILRAPLNGATLSAIMLTGRIWVLDTHWLNGRTQGCRGAQCVCQTTPLPRRMRGYCMAWVAARKESCIIELTEGPCDRLGAAWHQLRSLRGLQFQLLRPSKSPKGKVLCRIGDVVENFESLPKERGLPAILRKIWGWKDAASSITSAQTVESGPALPRLDDQPPLD